MEKDFQTSFIPKKPIMEERAAPSRPAGIFVVISIFILFAVIIATGGLYIYKGQTIKSVAQMESDLNAAKNRFEPSKIQELKDLDKRLSAANQILSGHIAISPIFQALQDITMKTVRFTKFSYSLNTDTPVTPSISSNNSPASTGQKINVKMSGQATGYRDIALQADLLTKDKFIIDPAFSNLVLNDKGEVLFDLDFSVDSTFVDYKHTLLTDGSQNTTSLPAASLTGLNTTLQ